MEKRSDEPKAPSTTDNAAPATKNICEGAATRPSFASASTPTSAISKPCAAPLSVVRNTTENAGFMFELR